MKSRECRSLFALEKKADLFSIQRRGRLSSIYRGGRLLLYALLLYEEGRASDFSIERRQTPSLWTPYEEEKASKKEWRSSSQRGAKLRPLYMKKMFFCLYKGEPVSGDTGDTGDTGETWEIGEIGETGNAGETGNNGKSGNKCQTGKH